MMCSLMSRVQSLAQHMEQPTHPTELRWCAHNKICLLITQTHLNTLKLVDTPKDAIALTETHTTDNRQQYDIVSE